VLYIGSFGTSKYTSAIREGQVSEYARLRNGTRWGAPEQLLLFYEIEDPRLFRQKDACLALPKSALSRIKVKHMYKKSTNKAGRFLLFTLLLIGGFFIDATADAATKMPAFSLPSAVDGKTVESHSFDGNVLLVTFFATWCSPCLQEIPILIELQNKFAEKGFSVVALSVDQGGPKAVSRLIDKADINYPVLMADSQTPQNFGGVFGIPTSFLVNQNGNVIKSYPGYVTHHVLEKDIKSLLQ